MQTFACAAVAAFLASAALTAAAAETPAPTPTPYPAQGAPGEEIPVALPSPTPLDESLYRPAAMSPIAVPPRGFRVAPAGGMLPTLGVGVSYHFLPRTSGGDEPAFTSVPLWAGVQVKPLEATFSPMTAVGAEFELYGRQNTAGGHATFVSFVPELRVGGSLGGSAHVHDTPTRLFPWLNFYGIGGYRVPNDGIGDNGGLRLGVGISSPMLMILGAASDCTPIPSTLEFVTDFDARTGVQTNSLRYGFQF